VLTVARLVLGEFAYAMPHHDAGSAAGQTVTTQASNDTPCPDHASAVNKAEGGAHHDNCCKTMCNCPCLHLSGMATLPLLVNVAALEQKRPPMRLVGATPERIFLLLRPPA
jgi:hypothetical protein